MNQANLTLVASKPSRLLLSEKEATKRYAADLIKQSWCVDVSTYPLKGFHAESGESKIVEDFVYDFGRWAAANNVRVNTENYPAFLNTLEARLLPYLPRIVGTAFFPIPGRIIDRNGVKYANKYIPFAPVVPDAFEMPEILEEYLSRVFMNEQDKKYITEWMADIIQNPCRRPQWSVVVSGDPGCGKSTLFQLVSAALGYNHTWSHNEYTPAFEKFSEVMPDHLLVCFDDAPAPRNIYPKLKLAITRKTAPIELKGVQQRVNRDVYARILICSNERRPLVIKEKDRRLYVAEFCEHRESEEETAAFFVRFTEWLDQTDTPAVIYHWLKSIDLKDFVPGSTIKTEAHARLLGFSASVLETLLEEFVADSPIFHEDNLASFLAENNCPAPLADLLKTKMTALNYMRVRRAVPGCGDKQHPLWQPIPKTGKRGRPITAEEANRIKEAIYSAF